MLSTWGETDERKLNSGSAKTCFQDLRSEVPLGFPKQCVSYGWGKGEQEKREGKIREGIKTRKEAMKAQRRRNEVLTSSQMELEIECDVNRQHPKHR